MTTAKDPYTSAELVRATVGAALAAGVVLAVAVLPAEFGLDPTGVGARLGLLRPKAASVPASDGPAAGEPQEPAGLTVTRQAEPYRAEETSLTLQWREGAEIKAHMRRGQRFVFSWTAEGGAVDVDMHGERFNAPKGEFTSYWKEDQVRSGHGTFEAPFDGTHGWFWQNFGKEPVTITVKTSGYFDKFGRP